MSERERLSRRIGDMVAYAYKEISGQKLDDSEKTARRNRQEALAQYMLEYLLREGENWRLLPHLIDSSSPPSDSSHTLDVEVNVPGDGRSRGRADLELRYGADLSRIIRVELKVGSGFQPGQLKRYTQLPQDGRARDVRVLAVVRSSDLADAEQIVDGITPVDVRERIRAISWESLAAAARQFEGLPEGEAELLTVIAEFARNYGRSRWTLPTSIHALIAPEVAEEFGDWHSIFRNMVPEEFRSRPLFSANQKYTELSVYSTTNREWGLEFDPTVTSERSPIWFGWFDRQNGSYVEEFCEVAISRNPESMATEELRNVFRRLRKEASVRGESGRVERSTVVKLIDDALGSDLGQQSREFTQAGNVLWAAIDRVNDDAGKLPKESGCDLTSKRERYWIGYRTADRTRWAALWLNWQWLPGGTSEELQVPLLLSSGTGEEITNEGLTPISVDPTMTGQEFVDKVAREFADRLQGR